MSYDAIGAHSHHAAVSQALGLHIMAPAKAATIAHGLLKSLRGFGLGWPGALFTLQVQSQ